MEASEIQQMESNCADLRNMLPHQLPPLLEASECGIKNGFNVHTVKVCVSQADARQSLLQSKA